MTFVISGVAFNYVLVSKLLDIVKKLVDIPDEYIRNLKVLAALENKSVKVYLQDLITEHVKEKSKKLKI